MKLRSVLKLINSSHNIVVQEETEYGANNEYKNTTYHNIETTMYGTPTQPIEYGLGDREVYCMFPNNNTLVIYLKNKKGE
jgi:hypothetical protein